MNQHKTSAELKALAKDSLLGKYATAIGSTLMYALITYIITSLSSLFLSVPGITGTLLYYISILVCTVFTGLFAFGFNFIFLKISCNVLYVMEQEIVPLALKTLL